MNTLQYATSFRLLKVRQAIKEGASVEEVFQSTKIDPWFLNQIKYLVDYDNRTSLLELKQNGFSDSQIAKMKNKTEDEIRLQRKKNSILPSYKVVDTCAAEFVAKTPYCYSSYDTENEIEPLEGKKVTKTEQAKLVGSLIGKKAKEAGVSVVKFDRGGFIFHGRVKALAEAAREAGLKF